MINYIKGLLSDLFGSAPAVVVEEVKVVKAPVKQRAGTVAEVKLAPLPATPAKKRKPYYGKKKSAAKAKAPVAVK
jgi:hypothetical protein